MAILAVILLLVGAGVVYAAAPHQRLLARPAGKRARIGGYLLIAAALACIVSIMGSAAAVFTWMTGLMLTWSVLPLLIGWALREKAQ